MSTSSLPLFAFALPLLGGCASVIGLEDDYYRAGAVGAAGESSAATTCAEHPIPAPSTWRVSASSQQENNGPSRVVDGSSARWSSGQPQSSDDWLEVDFGKSVSLSALNLQQGADTNDYPRSYAVRVSHDSGDRTTGSVLASGAGTVGVSTPILLSKVATGRYLSIQQLGVSLSWWSIAELEVSCSDK